VVNQLVYIYIYVYYKGLGSQGRSPHDVSYPCLSGSFRRRTRGPSWVAFDEFGFCLSSASVRALPPGEPLLAGLGLHADHCVDCSDPSDPGQLRLLCEEGRGDKGPKQESFGICTNQASGPFPVLHWGGCLLLWRIIIQQTEIFFEWLPQRWLSHRWTGVAAFAGEPTRPTQRVVPGVG